MLLSLFVGAAALAAAPRLVTAQIYTLPRVDPADGDFFGVDVAIDGDRVLVGATGVSACGENSGAAYIYERDHTSGRWRPIATLEPEDCEAEMFFGRSLGLSGDVAVVGAFRTTFSGADLNAAYVFERHSDGTWSQTARLTGDGDHQEGPFAADVDVDGDRVVVTTAGDLADGRFGGAIYVFETVRSGPQGQRTWRQTTRLTASEDTRAGVLGGSVAIDRDRIVVSASRYFQGTRGSVYVFEHVAAGRAWKETARLDGFEDFFISTSIDGDRIIVGESKAGRNSEGRATVFRHDGSRWRRVVVLQPAYPFELGAFGSKVAIENNRALVVGYDEQLQFEFNIDRVVYVFESDDNGTTGWAQRHIIDVGNVYFGSSVAIDENVAVIGQASDDEPGSVVVVQLH